MKPYEIIDRLNRLEDVFFSVLQEVRSIRGETQKQVNGDPTIDPLLKAEKYPAPPVSLRSGLSVVDVPRFVNQRPGELHGSQKRKAKTLDQKPCRRKT